MRRRGVDDAGSAWGEGGSVGRRRGVGLGRRGRRGCKFVVVAVVAVVGGVGGVGVERKSESRSGNVCVNVNGT